MLGSVLVASSTVAENSVTGSVGGILSTNGSAPINSSILWGNRDISGRVQSSQFAGQSGSIHHSCVEGLTGSLGGTGNLSLDPAFANLAGTDGITGTLDDRAELVSSSPVINRGDPALNPIGPDRFDLNGGWRVLCGRTDMGAAESGLFDYDCDGLFTAGDQTGWSACMSGPVGNMVPASCLTLDSNADGHVDLQDFQTLQLTIEDF